MLSSSSSSSPSLSEGSEESETPEWDVVISGELRAAGWRVWEVGLAPSRERRVGRFGVDLDWKPEGVWRGLGGVPLLGAIVVFTCKVGGGDEKVEREEDASR